MYLSLGGVILMASPSLLATCVGWTLLLCLKLLTTGKALLPLLLTLEALMLISLLVMSLTLHLPASLILVFFTLAVCEACLGLGVLIAILRHQGKESIGS